MKKEFGAPTDFGTLVSLLQSFKQEHNNLVRDFYNRLVLGYNEFNQSHPDTFSGAPWDTKDDAKLLRRQAVVALVRDFHLKAFFLPSLRAEIRKEVIREGETSIEDILNLAKRYKQAKLQEKRNTSAGIPTSVLEQRR